jgi:hypothetical protein
MLLVRPTALSVLDWASQKPFGLVHVMPMPVVVQFIIAFLLMDLAFYWWHVANHRILFLWRFYNVDHIDPDLDVSVSVSPWRGGAFDGVPHRPGRRHRSVRLDVRRVRDRLSSEHAFSSQQRAVTDRDRALLHLVIVTPRMHGIHHSQVRDETDWNSSIVFSWWDRLHRTLGLNIAQAEIVIGVPDYGQKDDNSLANALLLPFRRQRDYWRRPDGTIVRRATHSGRAFAPRGIAKHVSDSEGGDDLFGSARAAFRLRPCSWPLWLPGDEIDACAEDITFGA